MIRNPITAILASLTLALGLAGAPAEAGEKDDLKKFLGAAAGIVIIGTILNEAQKRDGGVHVEVRKPPVRYGHPVHKPHAGYAPRHVAPPPLPRACIVPVQGLTTHYGVRSHCLEQAYPQQALARLPQACRADFGARNAHVIRYGYSLRCLRDRGYQVAAY